MKPKYLQADTAGRDRWMISYLDVLTILLILFVAVAAKSLETVKTEPAAIPPKPIEIVLAKPDPKPLRSGIEDKLELLILQRRGALRSLAMQTFGYEESGRSRGGKPEERSPVHIVDCRQDRKKGKLDLLKDCSALAFKLLKLHLETAITLSILMR